MPATPRVAVIDYGSGNLRSVEKALQQAGADIERCASPDGLDSCDAVVLPGVGSFGDCARSLRRRGLTEPLRAWLDDERPYLGICLGYQILFERSEESPGEEGLGLWQGEVVRFPDQPGLKVPHMGWNELSFRAPDPVFDDLPGRPFVYFVHSFFPSPADASIVTSVVRHGVEFAASARSGSVRGVQFHPEKSQAVGLRMLENFVAGLRAKP